MKSLVVLISLYASWALANGVSQNDSLIVRTTSGTVKGFVDTKVPDVAQWLGVPYGAPPVGKYRFLPPRPAADAGDIDASQYKPICLQNSYPSGVFWDLVPEFQNVDEQAEDCLYLNIWGPRKKPAAKEKKPVIIWICGGGFQEGGGHAPYQVPDQWVQRVQTHLVVTFNYRLNAFGFPGARAAAVNAGLADVRLVVEWLRDNIGSFGGDPERMVLWGQSAGGNAADSYPYANPDDPIVSGVIASSGVTSQSNRLNTSSFTVLAGKLGCSGLPAEDELTCMQEVDAFELQRVLQDARANNDASVPRFGPAADNVTVFQNNTQRLEQGLVATVPLITGNTVNEGAAFAPFTLNQTEPPDPELLEGFNTGVVCSVDTEVKLRAQYGLPTYRYIFAGNFSNITPRPWLGAMHSSDLPVVFGTHAQYRGNSTDLEWSTSFAMEAFWASFATDSSESPADNLGLEWPEFSEAGDTVVLFGDGEAAQLVPKDYYSGDYDC